jgi:hypothetical protein
MQKDDTSSNKESQSFSLIILNRYFDVFNKLIAFSMSWSFLCNAYKNSFVTTSILLKQWSMNTKLNDFIISIKTTAYVHCSEFIPSSFIISSTSRTDENITSRRIMVTSSYLLRKVSWIRPRPLEISPFSSPSIILTYCFSLITSILLYYAITMFIMLEMKLKTSPTSLCFFVTSTKVN